MTQRTSTSRNARVAVRLTREEQRQVDEASKTKGYASPSAFIRAAIRNELDGRAELTGTDERMGAGFDRVSHDIFRVGRGQQALYALVDAFAKSGSDLRAGNRRPKRQTPSHRPRRETVMTNSSRPPVKRCLATPVPP